MGSSAYRTQGNRMGMGGKALPLALLGVAGYMLWQKRDQLGGLAQNLKDKFGNGQASQSGGQSGQPATGQSSSEVIPHDYDSTRPSVFNSTAMAGPQTGAGGTTGLAGGSMGTDLGTQGEGAL